MAIDPQKPVDPNAPTTGPHAPVQVFPAPGEDDPSVTATSVRELREEVLRELETDAAADTSGLNLATKIALIGLLLVSVLVIVLVLLQQRPAVVQELPVVAATENPGETPAAAPAAPDKIEAPLPPVEPPKEPQPAPTPVITEIINADGRLAEISIIAALIKEDPTFDDKTAIERLLPYQKSSDAAVRDAAGAALKPVLERAAQRIRVHSRTMVETAQEQLDAEDFAAAVSTCDEALTFLKAEKAAPPELSTHVEDFKKTIEQTRTQKLQAAFDKLEAALEANEAGAQERIAALLAHKDKEFATRAQEIATRVKEKLAAAKLAKQTRDAAGRRGWYDLFGKFHAAMKASDFDAAAPLLRLPQDSPMLQGGVDRPAELLAACAADIEEIKALHEAVLKKVASDMPRNLEVPLNKGLTGTLLGLNGRQLRVTLKGGATVNVKVETLSAPAISTILGKDAATDKKLTRALWTMTAYEAPSQGYEFLKGRYEKADLVPLHWAEYHRLHGFFGRAADLERAFTNLEAVLPADNRDAIKDALNALRPLVDEYEKTEPLNETRRKLITDAEKQVGRSRRMKLVLQNGQKPADGENEYNGQATDQITDYKDNVRKTDVGTQWGLKLGASGGLQRVLLRFDNLEGALGKARVLSATLEMYQIDSPQFAGAVIGLFRLKRPWAADSGSWVCFNTAKQMEWAIAGAGGEADIEPREDSRVIIDKRKNMWRSWDVTGYVSDVLTGKTQNHGFLMRVINNEPDYHVRFYPETDIENARDAKLRPRLVLEIEREVP
ncbi:MAG TPA: DNRLRE domain-containing protein [Planctomycetota bacterium]|nr:DNRLRE domain-containing protein [Planctomycetota bacterium]